jgi:hypothetical protein
MEDPLNEDKREATLTSERRSMWCNVSHVFQNGKAVSNFESHGLASLERKARRPIRKTAICLFGDRMNRMRGQAA